MKKENVRKSELTREKQRLLWEGSLTYEIEMFSDDGSFEIWYLR